MGQQKIFSLLTRNAGSRIKLIKMNNCKKRIFIMDSSIFNLKDGKKLTIRQVKGDDYDASMCFFDAFSRGVGAKWTNQYSGQPKKDRERSVKMYENPNNFFIAAWDDEAIVGMASASIILPNHPYYGHGAEVGITILEEYTSKGLGTELLRYIEKWARKKTVHKLEATVRHKNIRSIGALLKSGYQIVGIKHDTAFISKEWHHEYVMEKILAN